jgi:D-methionine transport system ATP-binding protein
VAAYGAEGGTFGRRPCPRAAHLLRRDGLTARLVAEIGGDVNILAGAIEEIAGEPFGTLVVAYPATPEILARADRFYAATGLSTEVLGYVA